MSILSDKFINEWFNNSKWWFNADKIIDSYITLNYQNLLDIDINNENILNRIIIYDQLPRHIFRDTQSNHIIIYFLQKAINILFTINNEYLDKLNINQWCFIMLPYRHTNNIKLILNVLNIAWEKLNKINDEKDKFVLKRFIIATYERCPMNKKDILSLESQKHIINIYKINSNYCNNIELIKNNFLSILEPPHTSNSSVTNINILNSLPTHPISFKKEIDNYKKYNKEITILSLSGGVDSMICSTLFGNFTAAIHINYCNRETSYKEEEFIKEWCNYIKIPLYIRRINEINRQKCIDNDMRDIYESYTRNVRYSTYKNVYSILYKEKEKEKENYSLSNNLDDKLILVPTIILGHNKDDCLENIFSNISNTNHYENLTGMLEVSINDDIEFIRPLLNISKNEIYNYANYNKIPYLLNSTPEWSERGQIRNNIVPIMNNWNKKYIPSLFNLSETMTDLHDILDILVSSYISRTYIIDNNYTFTGDIPIIKIFWKLYIYKLFKIRISNKSLDNLIVKLNLCRYKNSKININTVLLSKNISVIFLLNKNKFTIVYNK